MRMIDFQDLAAYNFLYPAKSPTRYTIGRPAIKYSSHSLNGFEQHIHIYLLLHQLVCIRIICNTIGGDH